MKETELLRRFKKKLDVRLPIPKFYYKIPDTLGLGGMRPWDAMLLVKGMFFAIEAKVEGRKVTNYQRHHLDEVAHAGGFPIELNEHNIEQVIAFIKKCVEIKELTNTLETGRM